ncbi:hypothetical protein C8Q80DRAFT_332386 [Daedaleopsis nitida]|nr:hypothetical protein C8Q80DRAFT_332386 [Daedaleopsis nitida]
MTAGGQQCVLVSTWSLVVGFERARTVQFPSALAVSSPKDGERECPRAASVFKSAILRGEPRLTTTDTSCDRQPMPSATRSWTIATVNTRPPPAAYKRGRGRGRGRPYDGFGREQEGTGRASIHIPGPTAGTQPTLSAQRPAPSSRRTSVCPSRFEAFRCRRARGCPHASEEHRRRRASSSTSLSARGPEARRSQLEHRRLKTENRARACTSTHTPHVLHVRTRDHAVQSSDPHPVLIRVAA